MAFFDNLFGKGKSFSDRMRYVEDFRMEEYQDDRGKLRRRAVYVGTWTVLKETGGKTLAILIGAAVLAIAAAVLLLTTLLTTHASSGSLLVMIPMYVALLPAFYLLMGAFSLPYRQKPMRRDQFMHGITRMQRSSVAILAFVAVGIVASFIYRIAKNDWMFLKGDVRFLVCGFATVLCCAGVLFLLGMLDTVERPNEAFKNA